MSARGKADRRRRRIEKQLRGIMRGPDGDACSLCRRPCGSLGDRTYGGTTKQGRAVLAGDCCVGELAEVWRLGLYAHETPWKAADARWFVQNPKRTHRIRLALPGEAEAFDPNLQTLQRQRGGAIYVVARQLAPGTRQRMMSWWSRPLPDDGEPFAHALFNVLIETQPLPGAVREITQDEIVARARTYETGGTA